MPRRATRISLVLLCATNVACAGRRTADGSEPEVYRKDLPNATVNDLVRMSEKILGQHVYRIERLQADTYVLVETAWNGRYPLEDELAAGVVAAETRIIIRGRPRARTSAGTTALQISTLTAENRVQLGDTLEWVQFMTPGFKEYMDEIVRDLSSELNQGVRVF